MTHNELANDLATHLKASLPAMVWQDMQLGPAGSPRPDVYAIAKTYTALAATAFEVKISVADFRRDVTAGKWHAYLKFASAVVFAAPAGLLKKEDIPRECGLIERRADGWRYARKPTRAPISQLPVDTWLKLVIDGCAREGIQLRAWTFSEYAAQRALAKRHGGEVARLVQDAINAPLRLADAIERARQAGRKAEELAHRDAERARARAESDARSVHADILHLARALGCEAQDVPQKIHDAASLLRRSRWSQSDIERAVDAAVKAAESLKTIQALLCTASEAAQE